MVGFECFSSKRCTDQHPFLLCLFDPEYDSVLVATVWLGDVREVQPTRVQRVVRSVDRHYASIEAGGEHHARSFDREDAPGTVPSQLADVTSNDFLGIERTVPAAGDELHRELGCRRAACSSGPW